MKWLVVLLVAVLVLAVLWRVRSMTARRDRARSIGPIERQGIEEEIRRRHGGSGPTVDGGQHLR